MSSGQEVAFVNQVCATRKRKMTWSFQNLSSGGMGGRTPEFPGVEVGYCFIYIFYWGFTQEYCIGMTSIPSLTPASSLPQIHDLWSSILKFSQRHPASWDIPFILPRADLKAARAFQRRSSLNIHKCQEWVVKQTFRIASCPSSACLSSAPHPNTLPSAPLTPTQTRGVQRVGTSSKSAVRQLCLLFPLK